MILGYIAFYALGGLLLFSGLGAAALAHALRLHLITPIAAVYASVGGAVVCVVAQSGPVVLLKMLGVL